MKCKYNVIFKGVEERQGGVFKNAQGQDIKYDSSYVVKFDENVDGVINERKVKFPSSNLALYSKFKSLEPYAKIEICFDVTIQNSGCKLTVADFVALK